MLNLAEEVTNVALAALNLRGNFLIKLFQGKGTDEYLNDVKKYFEVLKIIKPKASRPNSKEIYLLAMNFMNNQSI